MATLTQTPASPHDTGFSDLFSLEADPVVSSGIDELKSALGSIVIAETDRPTKPSVPYHAPVENKWTGTFSLFAFPRELRDEIYYQYLYRTQSSYYSRTTPGTWPFHADGDFVSLLLTCTQVYHEAIEVFHRYNEVEIGSAPRLGAGPEKVLNLFPAAHAQQLQVCHREYCEYNPAYVIQRPLRHFAAECWQIIIRDAYLAKTYFPKLRRFRAKWGLSARYLKQQEGMTFSGKTEEEKVQVWLKFMRDSNREMKALPPPWLKIELQEYVGWRAKNNSVHMHQNALNEAQARFVSEIVAQEGTGEDPEVLGSRWAKETSKEMSRLEISRRTVKDWDTL